MAKKTVAIGRSIDAIQKALAACGSEPPFKIQRGQAWLDTSTNPPVGKRWNGTGWDHAPELEKMMAVVGTTSTEGGRNMMTPWQQAIAQALSKAEEFIPASRGGHHKSKSLTAHIQSAKIFVIDGVEKEAKDVTVRDINQAATVIADGIYIKDRYSNRLGQKATEANTHLTSI